ncbi:MAG: tetratricopeptide repeat protein [Oscillospiraceae bacterium]|jgi:tetratricopeptide (TPR) repeat protein|nr:tetratricopeptide repeat protein [Oscillospiraceae bacterium]
MKEMEQYKEHKLAQEISRGIGRILYDVMPADKRAKIEKTIENHQLGVNAALDEAGFQMHQKNFDKALSILESLINKMEQGKGEMTLFRADAVSEYFYFHNPFEELLYKELYKPDKTLRRMTEDFGHCYYMYGNLLFELKRYEDAIVALKKAISINPVRVEAILELAEVYKIHKEWDEYLNLTKQCLDFAYTSRELARCYRNLGYYYIEQEEYRIATALYFKSMAYDNESATPQSQLFYIQQVSGNPTPDLSPDEVNVILKENNIPQNANDAVLGISLVFGKGSFERVDYESAKGFWSIFYDITKDEGIKKMIDSLPKQ